MEHIDDCFDDIAAVQLARGNGVYQDNDEYWYDNGHTYGFFNDGTPFADLLPISLRILFDDGSYVDLEDILTDLESGSVFTSSKSCDGEVDTDTDTDTDTDSSEVTTTCEATVAECSDEWAAICSTHFASSAYSPMVNEQAVGTLIAANTQSMEAMVVTNTHTVNAWYVNFAMEHIDDCFDDIAAVQLARGNGVYQDNDEYWYDNGHTYGFFNDGTPFADLLPISLRILFDDGSYVDLEDI